MWNDKVSKEFRSFKQMIERLNRTYKASYRTTNGFDNIDGANYDCQQYARQMADANLSWSADNTKSPKSRRN